MNKLFLLVGLAIMANVISLILYSDTAPRPGGDGSAMAFTVLWMPLIWIITIVSASIISYTNRKRLFKAPTTQWTIPALIFCTPFPLYMLYMLTHIPEETSITSTGGNLVNGKVTHFETWSYVENKPYLIKYFSADSAEYEKYAQSALRKDSTWIYYDKKGKVLKIEVYKNDTLISVK